MRCPACGGRTHVINTRRCGDDGIRRRRECVSCGLRVSTLEAVVTKARLSNDPWGVEELRRHNARLARDASRYAESAQRKKRTIYVLRRKLREIARV